MARENRPPGLMPDEAAIREALREVQDPEVGENIVDLGLVYRVGIRPGAVELDITMTTPACPAAGSIAEEVQWVVRQAFPNSGEVKVNVVFDPPWTPELMSEHAKQRFGWTDGE